MTKERYPKLNIRTKNDLTKRLSYKGFTQKDVLGLFNRCKDEHNSLWQDHARMSEPQNDKYVRDASRSELSKLLSLLDDKLLKPHDKMLPAVIHGGIKSKSTVTANRILLGFFRRRSMLSMDLSRFYDQITEDRVASLFQHKFNCGALIAHQLAYLCTVPEGPKEHPLGNRVVARGFNTSTRLAIWTNLDGFYRLFWLVKRELKGYDPRVAIYIDDIKITASRVPESKMKDLEEKIILLLSGYGLDINLKKTKHQSHLTGMTSLGAKLGRSHLSASDKVLARKNKLKQEQQRNFGTKTKRNKTIKNKLKGYRNYEKSLR